MQHRPSPIRALVFFGALMLLVGTSTPTMAAVSNNELAPKLLDRTVQRNGAAQIGMVLATVPVDASASGERKAVEQARRLRQDLVRQGVDPASIFIEARSADEVERPQAANR